MRSGCDLRREVGPEAEGVRPGVAVGCCGEAMAFRAKEGGGLVVDGEEPLRLAGRFEPAHDFLSPSRVSVRCLDPIV